MAVRLRLKRMGRTNRKLFRIVATDQRVKRDGKTLEDLGYYDPEAKDDQSKVRINIDRVQYWLSVGAQPSEPVRALLRKAKVPLTQKRVGEGVSS